MIKPIKSLWKFIKKLIKWFLIIIFLFILSAVIFGVIINSPQFIEWSENNRQVRIAECHSDIGPDNCTENGYQTREYNEQQLFEMEAEREQRRLEREQQRLEREQEREQREQARLEQEREERLRLAEQRSLEQAQSRIRSQLFAYCYEQIKNSALYPSRVDFNVMFGTETNIYNNFNASSQMPNRFVMRTSGEMINGFGNMIPFQASCKVDFNNTEFSLSELIIN